MYEQNDSISKGIKIIKRSQQVILQQKSQITEMEIIQEELKEN